VVAAALLGGCSAPEQTAAPTATAPTHPQLSAVAFRLREDEAVGGRFQVKVTNEGASSVRITEVALRTHALEPAPPTPRSTDLAPGQRVDLPVSHGQAVCTQDATDVAAVLTLATPDGTDQVVLPLAGTSESVATLRRIHDESCTAQRLAEVVATSLRLGQPRARDGALVQPAAVVLDRTAVTGPQVTVVQVGGSVLFGMSPAAALPATLTEGERTLEVPVVIRSTRCSGHEVGEAKKPFDLGAWLSVDGGEPQWTLVATSTAVQQDLRSYLSRACGR
jgi:hypothetical protein